MREIIEAEQEPDDLDMHRRRHQRKISKRKREVLSDPEDGPYASTVSASSGSDTENNSSIAEIMPNEVSLVH